MTGAPEARAQTLPPPVSSQYGGDRAPARPQQSPREAGGRDFAEPQKIKDPGSFIDQALRNRVGDDIAAFLAAFDESLAHDTPESRIGLREATDRLLRAGARTRIELERLEARVPLRPPEPAIRPPTPNWRYRESGFR
ncbi:MAG: hypothetical protein ACRDTV_26940 [Mycobacterium sp.]